METRIDKSSTSTDRRTEKIRVAKPTLFLLAAICASGCGGVEGEPEQSGAIADQSEQVDTDTVAYSCTSRCRDTFIDCDTRYYTRHYLCMKRGGRIFSKMGDECNESLARGRRICKSHYDTCRRGCGLRYGYGSGSSGGSYGTNAGGSCEMSGPYPCSAFGS